MSTSENIATPSNEDILEHLAKVRTSLQAVDGVVPDEILSQVTIKRNSNSELMICVPDPSKPGGTLCTP